MGHKFTYKHSANQHEISIVAHEDLTLAELMEVFEDYLNACGFQRKNIDAYFKGAI